MNWELIGEVADNVKADRGKALKVAFEEEQEDEHLCHSTGSALELWIESPGAAGCPSSTRGKRTRRRPSVPLEASSPAGTWLRVSQGAHPKDMGRDLAANRHDRSSRRGRGTGCAGWHAAGSARRRCTTPSRVTLGLAEPEPLSGVFTAPASGKNGPAPTFPLRPHGT